MEVSYIHIDCVFLTDTIMLCMMAENASNLLHISNTRQMPVPVIACLHGMCFGGGLQVALGADFRFSTPDCKLSIMESRWGLIPDMGASVALRELIKIDVAKELTMTGRIISGIEAENIGLVTRCVDDPMDEAMKVAKEIIER